ncbi:MAG: SCP2 sterol-binding domain-containing protein [Alphaproteobacteria bacterium]|nr:SCP2 sterol-binding domain-containing protein [Alphaproteobacteria bacterium]
MTYDLPTPLARAVMRLAPAPFLQHAIDALMRRMRSSHPKLFSNLARLDAATVLIEPSDVPHRFVLAFGGSESSLTVADTADVGCDSRIKGRLGALLDMLEGRSDGDKLFFSRDIEITGDTAVIVGLRNTLDREEISLMDDVTSMFGPFAQPARKIISLADAVAARVHERFEMASGPSALETECASLREENAELKKRLAEATTRKPRKKARAK